MQLFYYFVSHLSSLFLLLFIWIAVAMVYWCRNRNKKSRCGIALAVPIVLLAISSTPAIAYFGMGTLEWMYPPQTMRPAPCPAIVVLSGGIHPADKIRPATELSADTLYRCLHAVRLYRQGNPCPILVSGGKVLADRPGPTLAAAMRDFLIEQGVAEELIWIEDRSRNTFENAKECRQVLQDHSIEQVVLITSASHMYRAERCFRRQGVQVSPSACRYRATRPPGRLGDYVPSPYAAQNLQEAYHEWIGLAWYWLRGRI